MVRYIELLETEGPYLRFEKLSQSEPDLLITLRSAGDMAREELRRSFLSSHFSSLRMVKQVHSRRVVWAEDLDEERRVEADGVLSLDSGIAPAVTVADCMPIFLFGGETGETGAYGGGDGAATGSSAMPAVRAVLHSGWKGTGIAKEALKMLRKRTGMPPSDFVAVLGPSIRSCCYRVDEERANLFSSLWGENAVRRIEGESPAYYLDLLGANIDLLEQFGVRDIRVVDACTACESRFGSFRREGPESFTHMLAMIAHLQ